jgi:hypothetical protein
MPEHLTPIDALEPISPADLGTTEDYAREFAEDPPGPGIAGDADNPFSKILNAALERLKAGNGFQAPAPAVEVASTLEQLTQALEGAASGGGAPRAITVSPAAAAALLVRLRVAEAAGRDAEHERRISILALGKILGVE